MKIITYKITKVNPYTGQKIGRSRLLDYPENRPLTVGSTYMHLRGAGSGAWMVDELVGVSEE